MDEVAVFHLAPVVQETDGYGAGAFDRGGDAGEVGRGFLMRAVLD